MATMGVGRPTQLGSEARPSFPVAPAAAAVPHQCTQCTHEQRRSHPPAPISETSERSRRPYGPQRDCNTCTTNRTIRKYPLHYCAGRLCCYKLSDEGELFAKNFEHLPVCHCWCWALERDRLLRDAKAEPDGAETGDAENTDGTGGGGGTDTDSDEELMIPEGLLLCHRQCYMQSLAKLQDPDGPEKDIVPTNRCFAERLGMPGLEHRFKLLRMLPLDLLGLRCYLVRE